MSRNEGGKGWTGLMGHVKKFSLWPESNRKLLESCDKGNVVIIFRGFKRSPWLLCG